MIDNIEEGFNSKKEYHSSQDSFLKDDDISFKALTDGLGFHKKPADKKVFSHGKSRLTKRAPVNGKVTKSQGFNSSMQRQDSMPYVATDLQNNSMSIPGIEEFYGISGSLEEELSSSSVTEMPNYISASAMERFSAWFIDCIIVLAASFLTTIIASSPTLIKGSEGTFPVIQAINNTDFLQLLTPLFVLYYLFYFTLIERSFMMSLGKRVMCIRVIAEHGRLSLFSHLSRALISLGSIFLLGLPSLLRLQDRLTRSRVVQI